MRILIRLFIIIISFSISFCKTSRPDKLITGEVYFVDNKAGKDINPGTVRRPLKTIGEVNRRLKERPASAWFAGGQVFDGGVTNSLIQYCLSYDNEGAGYGLFQYPGAARWSGNVVRYCVSINDANTTVGAGSFFIWNGSNDSSQLTDCYLHNNVAYNTKAPLISFEDASDHGNFLFSNNIFIAVNFFGNSFREGAAPSPGIHELK